MDKDRAKLTYGNHDKAKTKWGFFSRAASVDLFFSVFLIVVSSLYPVLSMYLHNIGEVNLSTVTPLLLLFGGVGLAVFLLFFICFRRPSVAATLSFVVILALQNYMFVHDFLQECIPPLKSIHILPITAVLMFYMVFFLYRKLPTRIFPTLVRLLAIGFSVLLLILGIMAAPTVLAEKNIHKLEFSVATLPEKQRPNIYFMLFDEYSSFKILQEYFNFDNSAFEHFLTERKFTVSWDSRNESWGTPTVTAHLMMLDYPSAPGVTKNQLDEYRSKGTLHSLLAEFGYDVVGVGQSGFFGVPSNTFDHDSDRATTLGGSTFSDVVLSKTPLALFGRSGWDERTRANILHTARDYFLDPGNYTKSHNQFTLTYLQYPHQPFIFDEMGGFIDRVNWNNWVDPTYYLGQLKYTTKMIEQMVDGILRHDPGAVIIMQSDHGARDFIVDTKTGESIPPKDKTYILNAVYFGGERIDINGKSGVNTLRLVLSKLWGIALPEVEVPHARFGTQ